MTSYVKQSYLEVGGYGKEMIVELFFMMKMISVEAIIIYLMPIVKIV